MKIRHNSPDSISVEPTVSRIYKVYHQSQNGNIVSESEFALHCDDMLHIEVIAPPVPEDGL